MSEKQMMTTMTWLTKFTFRAICGAMTAVMYRIHGDYAMSTEMMNSLLRMSEELDDFIGRIEAGGVE